MRVLLLGLPGCGASSVGAAMAARRSWPFLDSDTLLERAQGGTAAQVRAEEGTVALRQAEADVLTLVLGLPAPLVACVPGGVVLDRALRERLQAGGHVVWLRASVPVLVRRLGDRSRPELGADPHTVLTQMSAEREALFAEVADHIVDVDVLTSGQAARQVDDALPAQVK